MALVTVKALLRARPTKPGSIQSLYKQINFIVLFLLKILIVNAFHPKILNFKLGKSLLQMAILS